MGNVYVQKRGKVYQYQFAIASIDGKRKYKNKSGFRTKSEAIEAGVKAYNEYINVGHCIEPSKMSYSDYLDYWMKEHCEINLKYHTIQAYQNIIKNHIKPKLGFYMLSQLTTSVIQEFINNIYLEKGFSKNFLKNILKVLKGSLGYATDVVGFIKVNPSLKVRLPKYDIPDSDPVYILSNEEVEKILERFSNNPCVYYAFLTAYYTGLRVSEVFGLTWDDIDFVKRTITVNKNTKTTLTMDNLVKYFNGPQKLMAKLVDGFGNPIANATVYFTINGKVHARITDENGTASIAIRLLPGEYKASALFNGTGDYDVTSVNASVLVKNTILGNDTTLYFRNGTQYMAKFLDSDGKALANTDVKFNINGVFYTRVTDENGIARLNIRLDPASYIITAYNPVTGEQKANNITVLPRIIAKDLSMKYLDGSTFNAALVDGQGKAISGVNITFNINGVFYHRTTDVNGVASLNIRLISGVYIITSMYDECWASNKIIISA